MLNQEDETHQQIDLEEGGARASDCRSLDNDEQGDDFGQIELRAMPVIRMPEATVDTEEEVTDAEEARDDTDVLYGATKLPRAKSYVKFWKAGDEWQTAMVLTQQPKRKGNYKRWVNVQIDGTDKPCSLNWQDVD